MNDQELRLAGVKLPRSGMELLKIIDVQPSLNYTTVLFEYFARQNLQMQETIKA